MDADKLIDSIAKKVFKFFVYYVVGYGLFYVGGLAFIYFFLKAQLPT